MINFKIVLYKSTVYKSGKSPIMLQATKGSEIKRITLGMECLKHEWNFKTCRFKGKNPLNSNLDEIDLLCKSVIMQAMIDRESLTLKTFLTRVKGTEKDDEINNESHSVLDFFGLRIDELKKMGKAGNAFVYYSCKTAISHVVGQKTQFSKIDYNFLVSWETKLRSQNVSDGGISNYMRTLRALYNEAIRRGLASSQEYPFSTQFNKNGYNISKFKAAYNPRAVSQTDLDRLKSYQCNPDELWAYEIFMFSYYQFGINFADIAYLKWNNIQDDQLVYVRKKTRKSHVVPLHEWGIKLLASKDRNTDYIFDIIRSYHKSNQQILDAIQRNRKQFNF